MTRRLALVLAAALPLAALAQTSATLDASTVTAANVFLYKLGGAAPQRLLDLPSALGAGTPAAAAYLTQPP